MNKKKIRQRDHKVQILEAAEKTFAKKGFYVTTMEEIAHQAQLAKGTIYLYFESKENLFFWVIEKKLDILLDKIKEKLDELNPPSQKIEEVICVHLKFLEENEDFFKITQNLSENLKKKMEKKLKSKAIQKQSHYIEILGKLIQEAIIKGEIKPLNSRKLAVILMGIIHSLTLYWISKKEKGSLSKDESLAWKVFWEGVKK
mgnify:CR=1 FL=1